jgi:hypothetical protein
LLLQKSRLQKGKGNALTVIPEYACAHVHMLHLEARQIRGECWEGEVIALSGQAVLLLIGIIGVFRVTLCLAFWSELTLSQVGLALFESLVWGWLSKRLA